MPLDRFIPGMPDELATMRNGAPSIEMWLRGMPRRPTVLVPEPLPGPAFDEMPLIGPFGALPADRREEGPEGPDERLRLNCARASP